jgi:hypothetical protein
LKFSDFDLSNGVNSTDFVPTDRKPKFDQLNDSEIIYPGTGMRLVYERGN